MKKVLIINYSVYYEDRAMPDDLEYLKKIAQYYIPLERKEAELRGGYEVCNENFVNMIRLLWLQGHYGDCDLELWFEGERYLFNEYAVIVPWPEGFMGVSSRIAVDILTLAMEKRKVKRV